MGYFMNIVFYEYAQILDRIKYISQHYKINYHVKTKLMFKSPI